MAIETATLPESQSDPDRPNKRSRLADGPAVDSDSGIAFRSDTLLKEVAPLLREEYRTAKPFHYCVVPELFDDTLLRSARLEIKESLSFTLKETDIYKVLQTGDLANLSGLPAAESQKLKHIRKIRDSLYSQEFRDFLHAVTSCGPLSSRETDMSINDYQAGCHLLNHDDVIGTRRVSYILYLPDPDASWTSNDGGSLELYSVDPNTHLPSPVPSCKVLPKWNQLVFFVVQPGKSFHSVEEVFNPKKSRLSISGWFHLPHEDEPGYQQSQMISAEEEKQLQNLGASLTQLKSIPDMIFNPVHEPGALVQSEGLVLSVDETEYLGRYIDLSFLKETNINKLQTRFVQDSHLRLGEFLGYDFACRLKKAILSSEASDVVALNSDAIVSGLYPEGFLGPRFEFGLQGSHWRVIGPPHKQRYLTPVDASDVPEESTTGMVLQLKTLLSSTPFLKWLNFITTCLPKSYNITARRFRPGLDYTLATSNPDQLLEVHLSLTPSFGWHEGELGGWDCYMASTEEEQSDPAIYKAPKPTGDGAEEDSTLLTINPSWNQLDIVLRDVDILTFTKYVSFSSPQSSWDVKGSYQIENLEGSDESA